MVKGMPKRPIRRHTPMELRTVVVKIRFPWWSCQAMAPLAEGEGIPISSFVRQRVLSDPRIQVMNPARKPRKKRAKKEPPKA